MAERLALTFALALAACSIKVEGTPGRLTCPDGRCPSGLACVDGHCVGGGATDAAVDLDGASPTCGNGVVDDPREQCDDGPGSDADACLSTCRFATCGDGVVREGVEDCEQAIDGSCADSCTFCTGRVVDGHCYEVGTNCNYFCAQGSCFGGDRGGHLLTVNSVEENQVPALLLSGAQEAWLWLASTADFLTGEPISFSSWATGQPTFYEPGTIAGAVRADNGEWRTLLQTADVLQIICEYEGWFLRATDNHAYRVDWRVEGFSTALGYCRALGAGTELALADDAEERAYLASQLPDGDYHLTTADEGCDFLRVDDGAVVDTPGIPCATTAARALCEHP
jgi:cysteine-rich repeat protein